MLTQAETQTRIMDRNEEAQSPPEAESFEEMVARFQSPLLRYAARVVRNEESAQDVVQEVFLRYLKAPPERAGRGLSTWLYRVTHNLCVDQIRKEARMRESCQQMTLPGADPLASDAMVAQERRGRLDRLLDRLTENQRAVLILKVQGEKSYREISEITGLTVSNVGFLIHRGLKKLAELIREEELI